MTTEYQCLKIKPLEISKGFIIIRLVTLYEFLEGIRFKFISSCATK